MYKRLSFPRCLSLALSVWCFFSSSVVFSQEPNKVNIVSRGDETAAYAIEMIELGLQKSGKPLEVIIEKEALSSVKLYEDLLSGKIDIIWSATNIEMEEKAIPVRIPLFKGLLGHRILIIHKENEHLFDDVTTMEQVRKYRYGQGNGWTDTMIMQANQMKVIPATKYESLFHMTDGKRFDAFPRGVHEPWAEITAWPDLELTVDKNIMFVYTMPYYLFVSPSRPELAAAIERGLLAAIDDGSFDQKFFQNTMVKMVMEKAQLKNRRIFRLHNPELPKKTPLDNPKLWVDIDAF